ncbi:MAG: hypothetical protein R3198_13205, partial [Marinobacter sp.]|nr:hypothetical protein [Marinobacter sp.]
MTVKQDSAAFGENDCFFAYLTERIAILFYFKQRGRHFMSTTAKSLVKIDRIDRNILEQLQQDGSL